MGKSQSKIQESYNPNLSAWELLPSTDDNKVWRNAITKEEIREYAFIVNESKEFEKYKTAHQLRYQSKTLVASRFFSSDSNTEMCSTFYKGKIYLEKIPFTIQNLTDIPFPQVLHIYRQAFVGFGELYSHRGYFYIDSDMIAFNNKFQAKVWLNNEFEKTDVNIYVEQSLQGNTAVKTEKQMIARILEIVDQKTNQATCPENLKQFITRASPNTIKSAENLLYQFASKHHVNIPDQIDSLAAVDQNRIKTNKVRLSELISPNRNSNSLINKVVTYSNQSIPVQLVNQPVQLVNQPVITIQNQNSRVSSNNKILTPQTYVIPQNSQNNFVKFVHSSNYRNTAVDSQPIEVVRNSAVNQSIKNTVNQQPQPLTNSIVHKNSISQQQLNVRLPVNNIQFNNNNRKNQLKIGFVNRPVQILNSTSTASQNNFGVQQNNTGIQFNIKNTPVVNNTIQNNVGGLNFNQIVQSNSTNTFVGQNYLNNNDVILKSNNPTVIQNNSSSSSNNITQTQVNQAPQTTFTNYNVNRVPEKNDNGFISTTTTVNYNTESQQPSKTTQYESQSIDTKSYSNTYDYLNSNYNTNKLNTYSNNETAGEFKYEYTSPQILALLSKNFNFSSTSPITEVTTTQKGAEKMVKLDGINEMKYSIYEDTSNKYIPQTVSYENIVNVQSSTQIVGTTEGKTNGISYGENGYSIALDPNLAKDLELFKKGNQRN